MKIARQIFGLTLLVMALPLFAQVPPAEIPYIEVNGTAELEVVPDEIYISISIWEKYNGKTKVTIEDQEAKLKVAIKSLGIDPSNLSLSNANASYTDVNWYKKDVLTKKEYQLKVSSANVLGSVFGELEKLEITDAYVSRVYHSKMDSLRKAVRIMAIKAAREKSDYLLTAIGEQTGKALIIRENDMDDVIPYNNYRANAFVENKSIGADTEDQQMEFKKLKIKASVYAKFAIK